MSCRVRVEGPLGCPLVQPVVTTAVNGETERKHGVPPLQGDTLAEPGKNSEAQVSVHTPSTRCHGLPRTLPPSPQAGAASGLLRKGPGAGRISPLSRDFSEEGPTRSLGRVRGVEAGPAAHHGHFAVRRALGLPRPTATGFPENVTLLVFLSRPSLPPFK